MHELHGWCTRVPCGGTRQRLRDDVLCWPVQLLPALHCVSSRDYKLVLATEIKDDEIQMLESIKLTDEELAAVQTYEFNIHKYKEKELAYAPPSTSSITLWCWAWSSSFDNLRTKSKGHGRGRLSAIGTRGNVQGGAHTDTPTRTHARTHARRQACMHDARTHARTRTHTRTHARTHTHTHTHTHNCIMTIYTVPFSGKAACNTSTDVDERPHVATWHFDVTCGPNGYARTHPHTNPHTRRSGMSHEFPSGQRDQATDPKARGGDSDSGNTGVW